MDAQNLIDNLEQVNLPKLAGETLKAREEVIVDLNAGQLAQGLRSDGSEILPAYTPLTKELKKGKSGLAGVTDHVTLYDEGDHYREMYAEVQGDIIEYGSRNEKAEALQKKYGTPKGGIYGLTKDSREELITGYLQADFIEKISEQTGL